MTEIATLYDSGIPIHGWDGLRIAADANSSPPGQYIGGRQRAVRAVLRELGIGPPARVLIRRATEYSVTFAVLDPCGECEPGSYYAARVEPDTGRVYHVSECGMTPASET